MSRKKTKPIDKKKTYSDKRLPYIVFIVVFFMIIAGFMIFQKQNSHEYRRHDYFIATFDASWTSDEIRSWRTFFDRSLPEIENELGRPPFKIMINITKGNIKNVGFVDPTYGTKFNPDKEVQDLSCLSPIEEKSLCLHEIIHHYFQKSMPENLFFREGMAIYLQKIIGDRLGYNNITDPHSSEYYYHLGSNYQSLDKYMVAPYATGDGANGVLSNLFPIYTIQYGLYGYYWKVLIDKDPEAIRKIAKKLWAYGLTHHSVVSSQMCLELGNEVILDFATWYSNRASLVPNSFTGYRFIIGNWPTEDDLVILHWETQLDPQKKGMWERPFDMKQIYIEVYSNGKRVYQEYTDMKEGCCLVPGLIKEIKQRVSGPFTIKVQSGGSPNLIDTLEIK